MVDKNIINAKISHINKYLERLQDKKDIAKELFLKDKDIQDIVLHNLQLGIQGCIDIASHIISDEGWGIPGSIVGLFDALEQRKVIIGKMAEVMKKMVGFRNIIVHEYEDVDLNKVFDIFKNRISDFTNYLKEIIEFYKL